MTTRDDEHGLLAQLTEWVQRRQRASRELKALEDAGPFDISRMAADVGMSADELADVIASGEGATELVRGMLAAHGLDRDQLAATNPATIRAIEVDCSLCGHKHRCEVELNAGTAAQHASEFCVNARLMQELAVEA